MKNTYLIQSIIIAVSIIIIGCSGGSSSSSRSNVINPNLTHEIIVNVGIELTDVTIAESDEYSGEASYDIDSKILEVNLTGAQVTINAGDTGLIEAESQITIIQKYDQYHLVKEKADTTTNFATSINGSTYMCPDLSYIPVIAQGYLQELPLNVNHCLGKDISLVGNFEPIGYPDYDITGDNSSYSGHRLNAIFDGNNKKIIGLTINKPNANFIGLFGFIGESGEVKQLTIEDPNVTGNYLVGALAGSIYEGSIVNVTIEEPNVIGNNNEVGALVGGNYGKIENVTIILKDGSKIEGKDSSVGGLVGYNYDNGSINNSRVTIESKNSTIRGSKNVGGLVGSSGGKITNSSVIIESGDFSIIGKDYVGGFVGLIFLSSRFSFTYENNYTNANVQQSAETIQSSSSSRIGGFAGFVGANVNNYVNIKNSYSTGSIEKLNDNNKITGGGGFIGVIKGEVTIENCYSTGETHSDSNDIVGFFLGKIEGNEFVTINNYYDKLGRTEVIGEGNAANTEEGIKGINSSEIENDGNSPFRQNGWDFDTVWSAQGDGNWPLLK